MKKFILGAIVLAAFIALPASSFALVNGEIYGGYTFKGELSGELDPTTDYEDIKGFAYGGRAHFCETALIFDLGMGMYAQYSPLKYDSTVQGQKIGVDMDKTTYGFDGYIKLYLPLFPIHPYLRGGVAIYDKAEETYTFNGKSYSNSETEYFKGYYYGVGISVGILPLPIISVQIFGEYLYNKSDVGNDVKVDSHTINLGVAARI